MAVTRDVILFRHGIAEDAATRGVGDVDRRLTPEGEHRTGEAASGLAAWLDEPVLLVHSPLVRARQTAALVADACHAPLQELAALRPGSSAAELLAGLDGCNGDKTPIAVGHEPDLSGFIAAAVAGERASGFDMKKAAACRLSFPELRLGTATLRWLLPPQCLRALASN